MKSPWILGAAIGLVAVGGIAAALVTRPAGPETKSAAGFAKKVRPHFDHAPIITGPFDSPQAVTRRCLECHADAAAAVMKTSHWLWLGEDVQIPGRQGKTRIGKRNLLNNFCIANRGNEKSCTKCHIGYGWADDSFDFTKSENVDCLV